MFYDEQGVQGVRRLLGARTRAVLGAAGLEEWNAMLGNTAFDCWLVGDAASPCPAQAHSRILVRRSWFGQELAVDLVTRRGNRGVVLPLPAPADGVRLLRRPFDKPDTRANLVTQDAHSLKRAPMFSDMREWLALGMVTAAPPCTVCPTRRKQGQGVRASWEGRRIRTTSWLRACTGNPSGRSRCTRVRCIFRAFRVRSSTRSRWRFPIRRSSMQCRAHCAGRPHFI